MIYVTGDTHAEFTRLSKRSLKRKGLELTEQDYVIVCGDFGLCWAADRSFVYNCEFFQGRPYTVLWVQGNHENYDMIKEFAVEEWHGGKVRHIVRDKVILLERGQVFEIEGKRFFTFGGASSHDIDGGVLERSDPEFEVKRMLAKVRGLPYRILGESWWPEELPSKAEMFEGLKNLEKVDYKVDYVITHCCSTAMQNILDPGPGQIYKPDVLTDYLGEIEGRLKFAHWYFGHYHEDRRVDEKHTLLYHAILPLEDAETDLTKIPRPGHPLYQLGDKVRFKCGDTEIVGEVCVVDSYGTFEQSEEPSYDILGNMPGTEQECLYKHIMESEVIGTAE